LRGELATACVVSQLIADIEILRVSVYL